jgi:hypothetical protein
MKCLYLISVKEIGISRFFKYPLDLLEIIQEPILAQEEIESYCKKDTLKQIKEKSYIWL